MLWDACCYSIAITTNSATATNRPFWHTHWDRVHRADTIDQVNTFSLTHTPTSLKTVQMKNSEIANECNESSFHDFLNKWVFHNFCFISKVFGCFVVVVVLLLKCIFFCFSLCHCSIDCNYGNNNNNTISCLGCRRSYHTVET